MKHIGLKIKSKPHHDSIVILKNKIKQQNKGGGLLHRGKSTNVSGMLEHSHFAIPSVVINSGRIINGY